MLINIQLALSAVVVQPYTTPGTYSVVIPPYTTVSVSMWGAGGAGTGIQHLSASNAIMYPGGSGAFVSCNINVPVAGGTIYLIVGGGGAVGNYAQATGNAIGGGGK